MSTVPNPAAVVGRFAPTPSGPLHLGSLLTAVGSWLSVRRQGGRWRLRIDDLDTPRCVPGAAETIQRQLVAYGLDWDGAVDFQSAHLDDYCAALDALREGGRLYACRCTRALLAETSLQGPDGPLYPGTCHTLGLPLDARSLWRFRLDGASAQWDDRQLGPMTRAPPSALGDFPVHRADGQIGYQLACVVDEARLGITEVLRGSDLIGSTAQQLMLMPALRLTPPRYGHLPLMRGADGRKLSKQNGAAGLPLEAGAAVVPVRECLQTLGYDVPALADGAANPAAWLHWALQQTAPLPSPRPSGML